MDDKKLQETIIRQIKILPKDVISLVLSDSFKIKLKNISDKYALTPQQNTSFEQETIMVLIGFENIMGYATNLEKELGITKEKAILISQDVGSQIFSDVKESLKTLGEISDIIASAPDITEENGDSQEEITNTKSTQPTPTSLPTPPTVPLIPEHMGQGTIIDEKLSKIVRTPTEKVLISERPVNAERPANTYKGSDPYREPIE